MLWKSESRIPAALFYGLTEVELELIVEMNRDINSLIMDYLISEGYPSAAHKFAIEANIPPPSQHGSIGERVAIRHCIHEGDIQSAIEKINDLDSDVSPLLCAEAMLL
jgi:glucose-induced degradation protein 8